MWILAWYWITFAVAYIAPVLRCACLCRKPDRKQSRSFSALKPSTGSQRCRGGRTGSLIHSAARTSRRSGDRFSCNGGEDAQPVITTVAAFVLLKLSENTDLWSVWSESQTVFQTSNVFNCCVDNTLSLVSNCFCAPLLQTTASCPPGSEGSTAGHISFP